MTTDKRINPKARTVLDWVLHERERQRELWGEDESHDASHTPQDWITILTYYLGRAAYNAPPYRLQREEFKKRLVQISAICLAALEAME